MLQTFAERKAIQRQFGIGRFSDISKNQIKMIVFMESLTESIKDYRAQLEASGTPAGLLDEATE